MIAWRTVGTSELDAPTLARIRALLDEAFAGDFSDLDWDHALGGRHVLAWEDGQPLAHGALVPRRLLHRGRSLRAGYVEALGVAPAWRRRGIGQAVMRRLEAELQARLRARRAERERRRGALLRGARVDALGGPDLGPHPGTASSGPPTTTARCTSARSRRRSTFAASSPASGARAMSGDLPGARSERPERRVRDVERRGILGRERARRRLDLRQHVPGEPQRRLRSCPCRTPSPARRARPRRAPSATPRPHRAAPSPPPPATSSSGSGSPTVR